MQSRNTRFVSTNLTPAARDALRDAVVAFTGPAGRRISMSTVLIAALRVAALHPREMVAQIKAELDDATPTE